MCFVCLGVCVTRVLACVPPPPSPPHPFLCARQVNEYCKVLCRKNYTPQQMEEFQDFASEISLSPSSIARARSLSLARARSLSLARARSLSFPPSDEKNMDIERQEWKINPNSKP